MGKQLQEGQQVWATYKKRRLKGLILKKSRERRGNEPERYIVRLDEEYQDFDGKARRSSFVAEVPLPQLSRRVE